MYLQPICACPWYISLLRFGTCWRFKNQGYPDDTHTQMYDVSVCFHGKIQGFDKPHSVHVISIDHNSTPTYNIGKKH